MTKMQGNKSLAKSSNDVRHLKMLTMIQICVNTAGHQQTIHFFFQTTNIKTHSHAHKTLKNESVIFFSRDLFGKDIPLHYCTVEKLVKNSFI
jgi:hypothetical protein